MDCSTNTTSNIQSMKCNKCVVYKYTYHTKITCGCHKIKHMCCVCKTKIEPDCKCCTIYNKIYNQCYCKGENLIIKNLKMKHKIPRNLYVQAAKHGHFKIVQYIANKILKKKEFKCQYETNMPPKIIGIIIYHAIKFNNLWIIKWLNDNKYIYKNKQLINFIYVEACYHSNYKILDYLFNNKIVPQCLIFDDSKQNEYIKYNIFNAEKQNCYWKPNDHDYNNIMINLNVHDWLNKKQINFKFKFECLKQIYWKYIAIELYFSLKSGSLKELRNKYNSKVFDCYEQYADNQTKRIYKNEMDHISHFQKAFLI